MSVTHLVIGPPDHGVVRFGLRLADLMGGPVRHRHRPDLVSAADLAGLDGPVHLQYTDALYAPHTTDAATAFERLRDRIAGPVSVTLHDLPDPQDEPGRYRRRADSYGRVARAVDTVMLSSDHEARLLALLTGPGARPEPTVVPLPVDPPPAAARRPAPRPEVAVFGFVYPGKGHEDVLLAMAGLPPEISFVALGRAADGHQDLIAVLKSGSGRRAEVTGFVPDADLDLRLRQVAVPVAPGRRVSASGSINTWIEAGRRPLVAEGSYTREFADRYPGAVHLYRPGRLPALIEAVLAEPDLSWLPAPAPAFLTGPDTARAYAAALRRPERVR